ncbi:MAG: hypothetical protein ACHQK9_15100, partial [Reyranellales bacterium]
MNGIRIGAVCAVAIGLELLAGTASGQNVPAIRIASVSAPASFATPALLRGYGFSFGPSDGQFGAMATGGAT